MFNLTCEITIGKYVFTEAHKVTIHSGRNLLTATANIQLSNVKTFIGNPSELDRLIKVDDEVIIKLGYDGENMTEFVGFVSEKRQNVPFEIICLDGMAKMKRQVISRNYPSITLSSLLYDLVPDCIQEGVPEVTLTNFRIDKATVLQVLNKIKSTYGNIDLYFRNGKLYAGLPYGEKGLKTVVYDLQKTTIKNDLIFMNASDVKMKVIATSHNYTDNTFIQVEVGDADGDVVTAHFGQMNKEELTRLANAQLLKNKTKSYRGSVLAWGVPFLQHGDIAKWKDNYFPERQQSNFIDEVTVEWGVNGFRRTLVPGLKAQ